MATYTDKVQCTNATDGVVVSTPAGATGGSAVQAWKRVATANASAANVVTETNASMGQAVALTLPDPGVAAASYVLTANSGFMTDKVTNITAGTTQTQAGATAITSGIVVVTTGNASDGIILPALSAAKIGTRVQVINSSAAAGVIYCPGTTSTNTINGTAGATGVAYAASKTLFLVAVSATAWVSTLSN